MNLIDDVTRDQAEIEHHVSSRGRYLDREDLFREPVKNTYLSLQRRLFFMMAGSFNVETRFVLDEKLRRLEEQASSGHYFVDDITSLNYALDSIPVTKEDNPLYFPYPLKEGRIEF